MGDEGLKWSWALGLLVYSLQFFLIKSIELRNLHIDNVKETLNNRTTKHSVNMFLIVTTRVEKELRS